jgi:hypothetical protein
MRISPVDTKMAELIAKLKKLQAVRADFANVPSVTKKLDVEIRRTERALRNAARWQ